MNSRLEQLERDLVEAETRASEAETRANEAEALMEEAEAQVQETEKHVEDLTDTVRQVEEQLELSKEAQRQADQRVRELEEKFSAASENEKELTGRCRELDSQLHAAQIELDELRKIADEWEARKEETSRGTEQVEHLRAELQALEEQQAGIHQELDDALARSEELLIANKEQSKRLEELQLELQEAEQRAAEANQGAVRLAELEEQLKDVQHRFEDADQRASEAENLLEDAENRAATSEKQANKAAAELDKMRERISDLEMQLAATQGGVAELEPLKEQLDESRARVTELEAEIEDLKTQAERIAELEAETARIADLEAQAQQLESQTSELELLRSRLLDLEAQKLELEPLRGRVAELEEQLGESEALRARIAELEPVSGELELARARVLEVETELKELREKPAGNPELEARIAELTHQYQELDTQARTAIEQLQQQLAAAQQAGAAAPGAVDPETEQLAFQDTLTGFPNANLIRRYLDYTLLQGERYGRCTALLNINLDKFAVLNETFGREEGDRIIRQVGERLTTCIRTSDVLARKTGDEYLILLSEVAGDPNEPDSAAVVVQRIQQVLAPPLEIAGQFVQLTAAIGVSQFPTDARDTQSMLMHAETAMRRAKELGRGGAMFYTGELQQRFETRRQQQAELERAVRANEFTLYYQPIVGLQTGRLVGVEALLRWHHPTYGVITPEHFLEVAEDSGQLVVLGRWVIATACAQLCEWARMGLDVFVSVNLSQRQFFQADLVETIHRSLQMSGALAHNLVLELPETIQTLDQERVQAVVAGIKSVGARVALDRFGSGFSSLERLNPDLATFLKIDRKFIAGQTPAHFSVATAAMVLARSMRLRPIAVGVETDAQLRLCTQMECELVQGNLIYTPVEAPMVAELARAPRLLR